MRFTQFVLVSAFLVAFFQIQPANAQYRGYRFSPAPVRHGLAPNYNAYYGRAFYEAIGKGTRNQQLRALLKFVVTANHVRVANDYDLVQTEPCTGKPGCYRHKALGYDNARLFLMGYYYLVQTAGGYGVREVYCSRVYDHTEFPTEPPAPKRIPNGNIVNTEHTWPQSRFNRRASIEEQKSDLHHLFPTDSQANATRGNHEFGPVAQATERLNCTASKAGPSSINRAMVFEPPNNHKGNVARALFYFSIRYDLPISVTEETTLRAWNKLDPVDQEEMQRNEAIYQIEGTRNPFIDYPDLADGISDF